MASSSFLNSINYGDPTPQLGVIGTSIQKPSSFLNSVNYADSTLNSDISSNDAASQNVNNSEKSADALLKNIGPDFDQYAKDSSGVAGLFLPGLAQQMQTNASPIIQNQLQTSMDIPPALLQKLMMASGGIPEMAEQQLGGMPGIANKNLNVTMPPQPKKYSLLDKIGQFAASIPVGDVQASEFNGRVPMEAGGMPVNMSAFAPNGIHSATAHAGNISKLLGIPNTEANKWGRGIGEYGSMALGAGGALKGILEHSPRFAEMALKNLGKEIPNSSLNLQKYSPKVSELMGHKLIHEEIPNYFNRMSLQKQKAYNDYNNVLDNPNIKVDDKAFHISNNPSDEILRKYLPKIQIGNGLGKFDPMKIPEMRNAAINNYKSENPDHIFPASVRSKFSTPAKDYYNTYLQKRNGRDLANLNQQLGYDSKFSGMPGDTNAQARQNAAKQGWSQTKQMLENHAESNGVLQSKKAGDLIHRTVIKPLTKTKTLRNVVDRNIGDRTPAEIDKLMRPALEGKTKLYSDDPLVDSISNLRQQMKNEKIKLPKVVEPIQKRPLLTRIGTASSKQLIPTRFIRFHNDLQQ